MCFRRAFVGLMAVLVVAALALPAIAQETTSGTLEGRVTDEKGQMVPGATVSATGPQGLTAARTGPDGKFSMPFLKPGKYEIKVEAPGFSTIVLKDVEVGLGRRVALPIQLSAGRVETVEVKGQAPMIDQKSTAVGTNLKIDEFVNSVPIGRTYSDTFAITPGVVSGGGTGSGNYSISGASGLENQYIVDGVNITNTGYGGIGSYNIVYGSLGTGVTTDFLDEVQVKTGGFEAEFGGATGGIINTTVKNGTNEFSGSVSFYYTPASLRSDYKTTDFSTGSVDPVSKQIRDIGLSVGGPIVKDKLFYFLAYNPVRTRNGSFIHGGDFDSRFSTYGSTVYTDFPAASLGDQESTRQSNNWAAKFTFYASPNHRFEITGFGDPSKGNLGPQNSTSLFYLDYENGGGQSNIEYGANNYAVKYNGVFTPNFFGEFGVSLHAGSFREDSAVDQPRTRDRRQYLCYLQPLNFCGGNAPDAPTVWFAGGVGFLSNADDRNTTYLAKLTNVFGPVEMKYGVEYADIEYTDDQAYSGAPIDFQFPVDNDQNGVYDVGDLVGVPSTSGALVDYRGANNYRVTRARFYPTPPPTKNQDLNGFVQWTWTVSPSWVLKFGGRITREHVEGSGAFTLPFADSASGKRASNTAGNVCDTNGDGNFNEECTSSYEPSDYTFPTAFAPRAGFTWDVTADGRSKLYLNVGRYYERIPNDLAVRSLSNEVGVSRYQFGTGPFDDATFTTPLGNPTVATNPNSTILFQGLEPSTVQEGTKLPYKDEAVLGYAYQLQPDLSIEVRGIYRKQGRVLEDVQFASNEAIQNYYYGTNYGYPSDPFPGVAPAPFGAYVLANPGENTPPGAGFSKPKHQYKAFELILNKRMSNHWLLYANYRYSRLRGNYEGLYRNDNGQSDPNITSLFDFPNSNTMRGQYQEGPLNNDRPHVLNIYGSYVWDSGLSLGAAASWQSGIPRTPLLAHPNYQNSGEIPGIDPTYFWWSDHGAGPVLEKGSSNKFFSDADSLMTVPVLYNYKDCGRGCFGRTPEEVNVDLHAGYRFRIGDTDLNLAVDVFNAFNRQKPIAYDDNVETTAGIPDVDFLKVADFQGPRYYRFSARWSF